MYQKYVYEVGMDMRKTLKSLIIVGLSLSAFLPINLILSQAAPVNPTPCTVPNTHTAPTTTTVSISCKEDEKQLVDKPDRTYDYRAQAHNEYGPGGYSSVDRVYAFSGYYDDFSNAACGWPDDRGPITDESGELHGYWYRGPYEGDYRIYVENATCRTCDWYVQPAALAPYVPPGDKYSVETQMRFETAHYWANMGLIFGADESGNTFYALCLGQDSDPVNLGWYIVRQDDYAPGGFGCAKPDAIYTGGGNRDGTSRYDWNRLLVGVDGDRIQVYIGGFYKGTFSIPGLSSMTRVGVVGGDGEIPPVDVRFQYFKVTSDADLSSPDSVVIDGPVEGVVNHVYIFTATVGPPTVTLPINYVWQPTGQTPVAHCAVDRSDTVSFTWSIAGPQTITVTASNTGGTVITTHTITITERPDSYEPDDICVQANAIPVSGTVQVHSFHDEGDEDWVAFEATAGITYVVEARVPPTSAADVKLEVYNVCGAGTSSAGSDPTFSPDVRLTFQPSADGTHYLRLSNTPKTTHGSDVVYHLSIRALEDNRPSGVVILVAGRLKTDDELQGNIHYVTNAIYDFALAHGCTADDIRYLATEAMTGVVGSPTKANLEDAITNWAVGRVGPDQPLTVYLMDHGVHDLLYLDKPSGEWITPQDLDGWLDGLGAEVPVNVVVEACYSGSFIDLAETVSGPGRVVIASTSNAAVAYATQEGARFSDAFLGSLRQGTSLHSAFEEGNWAARQGHPDQQPWLDDDGDGIANEAEDGEVAALRSLACETLAPVENWPPYVMEVAVGELSDGEGEIQAQVQDDGQVAEVWVVIYPPSYEAPVSGEEMFGEPVPLALKEHPTEEGWYTRTYTEFSELGEYRLVVYAEDDEMAQGRPKEMRIRVTWPVYLPVVMRQ